MPSTKVIGIKDFPETDIDNETLGLKPYVNALSEFVRHCQHPLTIAIQGDWGSGKTSLMQMIRSQLEKDPDPARKVYTVWINSWQLSQFDLANQLPRVFLAKFVTALTRDPGITNRVFKFLKAGAIAAAVVTGNGDGAEDAIQRLEDAVSGASDDLRDQLEKLVKHKREAEGLDRIVVFIDDLDRLVPEKALELLEVLKIFLDVPHCVFVLACDYQVIQQGQRAKFGEAYKDIRGKSFFDKIIQLPFQMPIAHYQFQNYLGHLLKQVGIGFTESDLEEYESLIRASIGFNPRSLKRLFNSLMLLRLVALEQGALLADDHANTAEKQKLMFALLCLQMTHEAAYGYLVRNAGDFSERFFAELSDEHALIERASTERDLAFRRYLAQLRDDSERLANFSRFMESFAECLQLSSDNSEALSEAELQNLRNLITLTGVVSSESFQEQAGPSTAHRHDNRNLVKALIEHHRRRTIGKSLAKHFGLGLYSYQPRGSGQASLIVEFQVAGKLARLDFVISEARIYARMWHYKKRNVLDCEDFCARHLRTVFPEQSAQEGAVLLHEELLPETQPEVLRTRFKSLVDRGIEGLVAVLKGLAEPSQAEDLVQRSSRDQLEGTVCALDSEGTEAVSG